MKKSLILLIPFLTFILSQLIYPQNLWQPSGNLAGKEINKLVLNYSGKIFALTTDEIYYSTDDGNTWDLYTDFFQNNSIHEITFNQNDNPYVLAHQSGITLYHSTDEGISWLSVNANFNFGSDGGLTTNIDYTMFVTGGSIYKSTDNGETWLDIGRPGEGWLINITPDSAGNLYVQQYNPYYEDFMYRSTDNGLSWTNTVGCDINSFGCNTSGLILLSQICHGSSGFYYGTCKSTDYGMNWDLINQLPYIPLVVTSEGYVFGYTFTGMQFSSDEGETWIDYNTGLPYGRVWALVIGTSGYLFAGTSDGVYRTVNHVTSIESGDGEPPTEYLLGQNYPNPFNPTTKINYSIPKPGIVQIKVFDILGKEIKTLLNEYKQSGTHEIEINAGDLPSGVYFYRLVSGNYSEIKKMVLIR